MAVTYDAVIVGAGPAGAYAAYHLAREGWKVLVLERHRQIPRKVCGEYLCPKGADLLFKEFGQDIEAIALPIFGMVLFTPEGKRVVTNFPNGGRGFSIHRQKLDRFLIEKARSAGAEIHMGAALTDVQPEGDLWLTFSGSHVYRASNVIGADGRSSRVSKLFLNDSESSSKRLAAHTWVETLQVQARFGEMHLFSDGSYIGVNPVGSLETNLSLVSDASQIQNLGGLRSALRHYVQRSPSLRERFAAPLENAEVTAAFPIQHITQSVAPAHHVFLIGDAAGFVDPLTGEGIFNALLSAQILVDCLRTRDREDVESKFTKSYVKLLAGKRRLNQTFQWILRRPALIESIAGFLLQKQRRADTFIGIVGNVYSPGAGLLKLLR
jgi:geranylgeranyl reductase family protein